MAVPTPAHRAQAMELAGIARRFPREAAIAQALADAEAKPPPEEEEEDVT